MMLNKYYNVSKTRRKNVWKVSKISGIFRISFIEQSRFILDFFFFESLYASFFHLCLKTNSVQLINYSCSLCIPGKLFPVSREPFVNNSETFLQCSKFSKRFPTSFWQGSEDFSTKYAVIFNPPPPIYIFIQIPEINVFQQPFRLLYIHPFFFFPGKEV